VCRKSVLQNDAGTPLNIAIVEKNWDIVKTIIKSGADVNLVSKNGKLSVEVCVEKLNYEMMQEHP
jgi:ankyrin repeat protein